MSIKAKARMATAAQAEREREKNLHAGHHEHLEGTSVACSCGEFFGVTTVAFPKEAWDDPEAYRRSLSCRICGKEGVVALGG
jgi:hypothetical protein